jgi:hypothetical protein
MEQKIGTCVTCAEKIVQEVQLLRNKNQELSDKNLLLEGKIELYLEQVRVQEKILEAEKSGREAANRGATLEDNPHDPDSDESASWSYGWLNSDILQQVGKAQAVMTWALGMIGIIHELAANGASTTEIAAKLATVVEKIAPYIPENEQATGA